jgi:uncharacterized protein YbjT (DUF2867 family)
MSQAGAKPNAISTAFGAQRTRHRVFMTGATGFMGRRLAAGLLQREHEVAALARLGSESRVAAGCRVVSGNALDRTSIESALGPADTFIQLVGTPHPSPAKARQFVDIDLKAGLESVCAAQKKGVAHFIYLSVAQPAPIMHAYIDVRARVEAAIAEAGLNATILRPWYVLGPGRRWPLLLWPMYKLFELLPATRDSARRLGLVTLNDMIASLTWAVENPAVGIRVLDVAAIRAGRVGETRSMG